MIQNLSLELSAALFTAAAIVVWVSGSSLSHYADAIAKRTGLGRAFVGVLFLGAATSLPEVATTASAAASDFPALAGSNLLGGIALQIAVLALIDGIALPNRALTRFSGSPIFLMQGALLAMLLSVAIAGISLGGRLVFAHIDVWSIVLAAAYGLALYVIFR